MSLVRYVTIFLLVILETVNTNQLRYCFINFYQRSRMAMEHTFNANSREPKSKQLESSSTLLNSNSEILFWFVSHDYMRGTDAPHVPVGFAPIALRPVPVGSFCYPQRSKKFMPTWSNLGCGQTLSPQFEVLTCVRCFWSGK